MRHVLLALLCAAPTWAADVYINGVHATGLSGQTLEKVTVRFDARGDLWIEAPGYNIKKVGGGSQEATGPATGEASLTKRYFLVTEQNVPGMTEYNVDVFINGKYLRTVRSIEEQIVSDITKHLRPGKNAVTLAAKKAVLDKDAPKSTSPAHYFRVMIGEGMMSADQVIIENPVVRFQRTAAEQNDVVQELSFTTK